MCGLQWNWRCGYICLYFTGSHFDVMRGVDGCRPPELPSAEHYNCMSWHSVQLNKQYAFPGVRPWPAHQSVYVVSEDSPSHAQARLYSYADVVKSFRAKAPPPTYCRQTACSTYLCTIHTTHKTQAHCVKVHKVKQSSSTTDGQHPSDSQGEVTAQGSAKCSPCAKAFASCLLYTSDAADE